MSQEIRHSLSQECFISNDSETIGFDLSSGTKWIYPENYPRRDYQFNIVQTALYKNTLVCLPTGLGKTFIAAVIMYNFWRWYPRGRVIFLAPTKPLVAQQIIACNEIMGIPIEQTVELTGAINQNKRQKAWTQKRVVFATPQTFQKDLQNNYVPYELIKCVVFDEAHKALGKHSYCEIIRMLNNKSKFFRVLALSATPGNKIDHVQEVIQNLHISELELRDDTSPDIIPYTNDKLIEKMIVSLSEELNDYIKRYINVMDRHVKILINNKILRGNVMNITKGRIFMLRKQYETIPNRKNHGIIMKTLNILLTMYHAYELLTKHGLRAFYNFFSNHSEKFWLETELDLQLLLKDIKKYIGDLPKIQPLLNETNFNITNDVIFGHDKFYKLSNLLVEHFNSFSEQEKNTRAIVFVEYRDIVNEIYVLLMQKRPLIRPQIFVGQAGLNQKQQLAALENFKNNKVNVLISTSVGEEGLDIGEVDLIVCFDISTSTPIRLVQRMGRTGRKRYGRVVVLLTEGIEEQTFYHALSKRNSLNHKVLQSSDITSSLYKSSPRMIPVNITPQCLPIFIKPQNKKIQSVMKNLKKQRKDTGTTDTTLQCISKNDFNKNNGFSQSTMMKFLKDRCQQNMLSTYNYDSDSGILSEEFQIFDYKKNTLENLYSVIKPKDVKILTSDIHTVDFLTLCTIKKSEKKNSDLDLKVDKTWIPIYAPANIFHNFEIPSLNALDCIENLNIYKFLIKDDTESISNLSIYNSMHNEQNSEHTQQNCLDIEPKYTQMCEKTNLNEQNIKKVKSNFFNNVSTNESKYMEKCPINEFEEENIETCFSNIFDNDRFIVDSKYYCSTNFKKRYSKENINTNFDNEKFPNFEKVKEFQNLSLKNLSQINAVIEVDFKNILDECTEFGESKSQVLINNRFEKELENSSDDVFNFSQNQYNITIVPNIKNNNIIMYSPKLTGKRSASNSPSQESDKKKQRVSDIDSSDSEKIIIFGTPQKTMDKKPYFGCNNKVTKSIPENVYPDSDQDLFDELDFETPFSFTAKNDEISVVHKKNSASFEREKKEISFNKEKYEFKNKIEKSFTETLHQLNEEKISDEINKMKGEENLNEDKVLSLVKNNISLHNINKKKNTKVQRLSKNKENEPGFPKEKSMINICDLNLDIDWNDDFDFVPSLKNLNNKKKGNNFCLKNINFSTRTPKIKESSFSDCISIDITRETTSDQSKIVENLKNVNIISSSKENCNFPGNLTTSLLYKKNSKIESNKFIKFEKKYKNKNNDLLNLSDYKKQENNISSQFQKYNKKTSNYNKKNKVRRLVNNFVHFEAEVSSDYETSQEGSDGEDENLTNFISYTQEQSDAVDMEAYYLQTLNKSPIKAGAFVFKPLRNLVPNYEIYSQPPSQADDTYLNDSFCVGNETYEDDIGNDSSLNDSILENRKKKVVRRKQSLKFEDLKSNKKQKNSKRILKNKEDTTSSSEDEIETLRKQIFEESMLLKQLQS